MPTFKAPDYTPLPSGIYTARFEGTEERESERGGYVRWGWRSVDGGSAGQRIFDNTTTHFGPQAKARKWLESMLGRRIEPGETGEPDNLIGRTYTIRVANTAPDGQGRVFDKVVDVLGPVHDPDEEASGHTST